jgi:hypothetical protein
MNKIKLLLLISFTCAGFVSRAQQKDKEAMINTVFSVLKNGDEKGFINLFPDAAVTKEVLEKIFTALDTSGKGGASEMMNSIMEKITDSALQEEYREQFNKTNRKAKAKGINWSSANLVSFTADSVRTNEEGLDAGKLTGKIYFTTDSGSYFMAYKNVIWLDGRGWYGVTVDRIDEKSKEMEEEKFDDPLFIETDTAAMAVDTTVAVAPPKPVKKAKPVKPVHKPIKPTTATPARKPKL